MVFAPDEWLEEPMGPVRRAARLTAPRIGKPAMWSEAAPAITRAEDAAKEPLTDHVVGREGLGAGVRQIVTAVAVLSETVRAGPSLRSVRPSR